ncbi:phosphoribosyltransferase [Candidatus Microgenomates bacterium]|nr:phosphoribosyltransferase [Candidatus Microgenomates bacterium]
MFDNREQAGELLSKKLENYKKRGEVVVLGIPRGGVVVASKVAELLKLSLDIVIVKKIGAPHNPELAIGAVAGAKIIYWDNRLCRQLGVQPNEKLKIKNEKLRELAERERLLRGKKNYNNLKNKTVILVDDGVATGATAIAAGKFIKKMAAQKIILAVPVIAKDTLLYIKRYFDEVVFLESPEGFHAVGQFYQEFNQITDDEVRKLL